MSIRRTSVDRLNEARKSSLPTIGKGKPLNSQGNEGDLTFRRTSEGLKLYIKANHSWHGVKVGESFSSLESTINDIKSKVDVIRQFKLPSTYSVTGRFTLDASQGIYLDSGTGRVYFYYGGDTDDYMRITVGASGATTLRTFDSDGTSGNLTLNPDGDIILDSDSGNFISKNNGTEFSAANSSYAGMTLGYTHLTTSSGIETYDLTTSFAVVDADAKVTFVAPPSGNVEIEVNVHRASSSSNKYVYLALSDNATYNQATAQIGDGSTSYELIYSLGFDLADETDDRYLTAKFVACGLTAGSSYTYWVAGKTSGTTTRLRWGGNNTTSPNNYYAPFVIKATALPASIHTQ